MTDERDLLKRARALEAEAFGEIYDKYYDALYRFIYYRVRHVETAQDLAAEVFSQLVTHISEGRGPNRNLRAWLYRVARNRVIDESRRHRVRDHVMLDEQMAAPGKAVPEAAEAAWMRQAAREALDRLSPNQRDVLILHYLQGLEIREIAQIMGTTTRNIRALRARGLEAMRKRLVESGAGEEADQ